MFFDVALGRPEITKNGASEGRGSQKSSWVLGAASRTLYFEVKKSKQKTRRIISHALGTASWPGEFLMDFTKNFAHECDSAFNVESLRYLQIPADSSRCLRFQTESRGNNQPSNLTISPNRPQGLVCYWFVWICDVMLVSISDESPRPPKPPTLQQASSDSSVW